MVYGYTQGKLVLQYLSTHPERHTFKLQAGGRSPSKILSTIADVGATADDIKIVVFDLSNYDEVEKAVLGATVVLSCAGPFYRYGSNVVRSVPGFLVVSLRGESLNAIFPSVGPVHVMENTTLTSRGRPIGKLI